MPIRVNLKELFPSDSQEITIDKVNFNFNKLLELGIGEPGIQGLSGLQGPAGPTGLTGPTGLRGSTWFVDAGDPNTLTGFVDLIDNDLYLDSASFDVWQYDLATDTWSLITSISTIVNNYLSTTSSPFRRGLGLSSPEDDRFITFNRRGNLYLDTQLDVNLGTLNPANNDTLFLNNFDENVLDSVLSNFSFTAVPGELFNSLLSIYANHSEGAAVLQGRYHLEMGALYENTQVSPSQVEMSDLRHNLKVKFLKDDVSLTTPLTNTNYWLNIARFSLGKLEAASITTIDQNGRFEFVLPKYNNEGLGAIQSEVTVRLGSAEALIEQSAVPAVVADGISISSATNGLILGLKEGLENDITLPYSAGNADFALFDVSSGLNGFFFNDRLVQSNGNIEQIHTTSAEFISKSVNGGSNIDGNSNRYYSSIFSNGKYLITSFAGANSIYGGSNLTTVSGRLQIRSLDSELTNLNSITNNSEYPTTLPASFDNHGHPIDDEYGAVPGTSITNVKMMGKYLYITRVLPSTSGAPPVGTGRNLNTFIVAEIDSSGNSVRPIGYSIPGNSLQRVEVVGSIAYVLNKREAASPWLETNSELISIDISDPTNPIVLDTVGSPASFGQNSDNYLDLEIVNERAFVSTYTESDSSIRIKQFDIHDPSNLTYLPASNGGTIVVASLASEKPAQLKAAGTWLFCSYSTYVYVYNINVNNTQNLSLVTSFEVDPDIEITDFIVSDRYVYVLGENTITKNGMLATVDISDIMNAFTVAIDSRSEITAPGKMTMVGNKIYVSSSQGTGGYSGVDGGLSIFEVDGITSAGANISNIQTNDLRISKNAYVGESLDVGNSINVGSGGIFVDEGVGIVTDSPIVTTSRTGMITKFPNGIDTTTHLYGSQVKVGLAASIDNLTGLIVSIIGDSGSTFISTGEIVGFNFELTRYANISGSVYGSKIEFGNISIVSGNSIGDNAYGYYIDSGADMSANKNFYGFYSDSTGVAVSGTGKKYGIYSVDSTDNYLEGTTTIDDVLALTPRASDPSPATNGMIYYNSGTNKLRLYANNSWTDLN